jgi:SH3-like domain-containing protein
VTIPVVALFLLVPFYIVIAGRVSSGTLHAPELPWDRALPLQPTWALVYGSLYAFLIALPVFVVRQEEHIRRTFRAYLAVWIAAYVCFLVYPTVAPRPAEVTGEGFAVWGLRSLYGADPPYNCFPSLHVAHSFVSALTCYRLHRQLGLAALGCASLVAQAVPDLVRALVGALLGLAFICPTTLPTAAQTAAGQHVTRGPSGLPLPRFVSLKSGRVNSRIGPGLNYAVDWLYMKPGLPMEIIQEYDNWRRVRDSDGSEGWINQSLLSGRRTAIAAPWQRGKDTQLTLLAEPDREASTVAIVEPGVVGTIKQCNGEWCQMTFDGHTGWIAQTQVWGAYPGEQVKD